MDITPLQKISFLVLRIMGSLIFITAGLNHLFDTAGAATRLGKASFGHLATWMAPAESLVLLSGIGLVIGGILLLSGFKTKLAALLLLALLIPITLTVQVGSAAGSGPLLKNIALIGMLLFFIVNGAVYYGLDQLMDLKKKTQAGISTLHTGKYLAVLTTGLVVLLSITGTTVAQATIPQGYVTIAAKKNYAVLISQPNHLKAAVHTAETITSNSPYKRDKFVVMACSKSVEAFLKGGKMEQEFEKGKAAGVTYKVCGLSLKQLNIEPAMLLDGVEVIPNGLTYMFDLQQQGFITVEL
ncbi:hypothetical protein OB13_12475 [Pontibacter sp. HJ8]